MYMYSSIVMCWVKPKRRIYPAHRFLFQLESFLSPFEPFYTIVQKLVYYSPYIQIHTDRQREAYGLLYPYMAETPVRVSHRIAALANFFYIRRSTVYFYDVQYDNFKCVWHITYCTSTCVYVYLSNTQYIVCVNGVGSSSSSSSSTVNGRQA